MKILLVEDDWLQSDSLISEITSKLPIAEITLIESELDFRNLVSIMKLNVPDIILLDIMLRWTNTSSNMILPPDGIKADDFFNAGFRCQRYLEGQTELKNIPIIFYTVLEKLDLEEKLKTVPKNVTYLSKVGDISILINLIKRLTTTIKK